VWGAAAAWGVWGGGGGGGRPLVARLVALTVHPPR